MNNEATLLHDEEALYCIMLRNRTNIPLFPYVFYFDSGTYSIERCACCVLGRLILRPDPPSQVLWPSEPVCAAS